MALAGVPLGALLRYGLILVVAWAVLAWEYRQLTKRKED